MEASEMQAVDQQVTNVASPRFIGFMAGFVIIAAVLLILAGTIGSHNATSSTVTDAALATAAFRAGERAALPLTAVQLTALNNAFRAGERASLETSGVPTTNGAGLDFRAGERGDPGAN
jgi:cytochrome c biogenesis protein CcdA